MENLQIERRTVKDTDVFIGSKMIKEILPRVRTVFEEGALFVVYEEEQKEVAEALMQELKRGGYRVFASEIKADDWGGESVDIGAIPEYVRFVFGVGEARAARVAKRVCGAKNIDWNLYMCTPSCDEIMQGIFPKQVFIDTYIIDKSPKACVASGYGLLLAKAFSTFEDVFASKVLSIEKQRNATSEKQANANGNQASGTSQRQAYENDNQASVGGERQASARVDNQTSMGAEKLAVGTCARVDNAELACMLLNASSEKCGDDSADKMAKLLFAKAMSQGKKPRLLGEYKFLCACLITAFYSAFLGAPSIDAMPPSCVSDALDEIASLPLGTSNEGKCVDFFDINGYFRINYILSEYRMDLLEKLSGIDLHGMQRFWRRLYPDAGYWLKSEISAKEMLHMLSLAGAQSDNLLGYAYASGILKKIG